MERDRIESLGNMENPLENGTFITYDNFIVKDKSGKIKDEYKLIIERADVLLSKFKKDNPEIVATYEFDHINKEFWLWDKHGRQKAEENTCRDFLSLLNNRV